MSHLDSFEISLAFDDDGDVTGAEYEDVAGCGYTRAFALTATLGDVIGHHLMHHAERHDQRPRRLCTMIIQTPQGALRCTVAPHGADAKHVFEL